MDPFTEKELIDAVKNISRSLEGIRTELNEINMAIREAAEKYEISEDELEEEGEFEEDDDDEEEDSIADL